MADDPDARPEHNYLLFGKDPGEEAPTYAHAAELKAGVPDACRTVPQRSAGPPPKQPPSSG